MRMTREYAFDLITKLGDTIQRRMTETKSEDTGVGRELRELQRRLQYGDIRPTECVRRLHEIAESSRLAGEEWRTLMRSMVL